MDGQRNHVAGSIGGGCAACRPGLDRREFLERSLLAAAAALLAGCAVSTTTASVRQFTINVGDYPALASVGGIAVLDSALSQGNPIAVSRTGDSSFVALSLVCPHRGFTVEAVTGGFYCPGHGAQFAPNGAWTGGQPTSGLATYPVQYDATSAVLTIG
jgi:nitrite reductase/ring-hydroxylating ferredoxin subunit